MSINTCSILQYFSLCLNSPRAHLYFRFFAGLTRWNTFSVPLIHLLTWHFLSSKGSHVWIAGWNVRNVHHDPPWRGVNLASSPTEGPWLCPWHETTCWLFEGQMREFQTDSFGRWFPSIPDYFKLRKIAMKSWRILSTTQSRKTGIEAFWLYKLQLKLPVLFRGWSNMTQSLGQVETTRSQFLPGLCWWINSVKRDCGPTLSRLREMPTSVGCTSHSHYNAIHVHIYIYI